MWCGLPPTAIEIAAKSDFTSVHTGTMPAQLSPPSSSTLPSFIHTLPNVKFDKSAVATINGPTHTTKYLLKALHGARRTKSVAEVELMKKAQEITAGAHLLLLKGVGRGEIKDENEAEAVFVAHCRKFGAKQQAYLPIGEIS